MPPTPPRHEATPDRRGPDDDRRHAQHSDAEPGSTSGADASSDGPGPLALRLYGLATGDEDARLCRDIPEEQCREQPRSFLYQTSAQALSKTGDVLADSKVVLPWLLGMVGAPAFLVGFLVPIRESFALLPQLLVGGVLRRFAVRKYFWAAASAIEGVCVILMGVVAVSGIRGAAAGWAIVGLLVLFSLARGVASIAAKDTLGKTVSKGRRGRVGGYGEAISGIVAVGVGAYLAFSPQAARPDWVLYAIVVFAGLAWLLAAGVFALINEYPGATEGGRGIRDLVRDQVLLLARDRDLQRFLVARALLVSTALAGPVYVSLAQRETGATLDGLGWLIIASGLAGALSASAWGALSDRSSRLTMAVGGAMAGVVGLVVVVALALAPGVASTTAFYAVILFVLGLAHSGVRIGRKTHVVDLAGGERRAEYVALSNTLIGLFLLLMGALTAAVLGYGLEIGILMLSVLALLGAGMALAMKHVQD